MTADDSPLSPARSSIPGRRGHAPSERPPGRYRPRSHPLNPSLRPSAAPQGRRYVSPMESRRPSLPTRLRSALNLATDYDRRLRERWAADWAASLPAGSVLLDAGAGDFHLRHHFPTQTYIGLDIRPRFSGREHAAIQADLHCLPLGDSSVDNVVSLEVLEHVRDPSAVLCEVHRVLRPGGQVCFSVPQAGGEHEQPFDYFRYTSFGLRELARASGLEPRSIRMKGHYFRRLSAELRDLPFVVLPEHETYRFAAAVLLLRSVLVVVFTFVVATLLLPLDALDRSRTYTTGYFCVFVKPRAPAGSRSSTGSDPS